MLRPALVRRPEVIDAGRRKRVAVWSRTITKNLMQIGPSILVRWMLPARFATLD